jgi:hypothetical protein
MEKAGPGRYTLDTNAVARRTEELPKRIIKLVRRVRKRAKCPLCGRTCCREKIR